MRVFADLASVGNQSLKVPSCKGHVRAMLTLKLQGPTSKCPLEYRKWNVFTFFPVDGMLTTPITVVSIANS